MTITPAQERMLRNLCGGRPATYGLSGRSAMGGASATWWALHRAGLLHEGEITKTGCDLLKQMDEQQKGQNP